jgi:hypothetical protein
MIFGITHSKEGIPRQRLTVAYKVRIGIPAEGGRNYPQKLDHFQITSKNENGDWIANGPLNNKLEKLYGRKSIVDNKEVFSKLREFDIVFLQDPPQVSLPDGSTSWDLDEIFKTEFAWWSKTQRLCSGNGAVAQRNVEKLSKEEAGKLPPNTRFVPWTPCGDGCPQHESGDCKPSGVLYFLIKDEPVIGSVASYTTTSYETIQRIQGSLMQILQMTGGRLRGIPLKAVLRPGKTKYQDDKGTQKTGNAFFVNIEFRQEDWETLVPRLLEGANSYAKTVTRARMISEHIEDNIVEIDDEPETERAHQMTAEFSSHQEEPAKIKRAENLYVLSQEAAVFELNTAQQSALLGAFENDSVSAGAFLAQFNGLAKAHNKSTQEAREIFNRALLQPGSLESLFAPVKETPAEPKKPRKPKAEPVAAAATAGAEQVSTAEPKAKFDF